MDKILTPDFSFILSFTRTDGIDQFKKLVSINRTAFENLTYIMDDVVVEKNKAAAYWTMIARHVNTWRGIAGTGKDVKIEGISFFRFASGKIKEVRVQNDVLGLMQQLGAEIRVPDTTHAN